MFSESTKFLVVDDSTTVRRVICKVLGELGFTNVIEVDDGKTAVPALQEANAKGDPFGVIISDWNMPIMQGIDLLRYCKSEDRFKNTPFIILTAENEQKNILGAVKAGVSDYVVKPFNSKILNDKLKKVWELHHGTKSTPRAA
ncbi:MAG: response regulator [Pseudobdellovibrionaceae bacterium]